MYTVYRHTTPSGKVYIGITKRRPAQRWKRGCGYTRNLVFMRAIHKYGWDNIEHEVLYDGLTEEEAKRIEVELIAKHNATDRRYGYNITAGGDHHVGAPCSEENRERVRLRFTGANNPCARKVICLETLETYDTVTEAESKTGACNITGSCKRHKGRQKAGGYHWAYYDPSLPREHYTDLLNRYIHEESVPYRMSEERKRQNGEAHSIPVICLDTGEVYKSLQEASDAHGLYVSNLCKCVNGRHHTAGGLHWAYYDSDKPSQYYEELLAERAERHAHSYDKSEGFKELLRERSSIAVECVETGVVYPSQKAAEEATSIKRSSICCCCKGKQHTAGGYHWRYADGGDR